MKNEHVENDLWVFIRGLGRESGHWFDFAKNLQSKIGPIEVLYLDLPGCGSRFKESSPTQIQTITDLLNENLKKNVPNLSARRIYILGMSLGGMVAVDWMQRYPQIFSGAVLINTSLRNCSPVWRRIKPFALMRGLLGMRSRSTKHRERIFLQLSTQNKTLQHASEKVWNEIQKRHPVRNNTVLRQLVAASRFTPEAKKIKTPTLLICSRNDQIVNFNCSLDISRKWDLPVELHEEAGHDICLEQSAWVSDKIYDFVNR